METRPSTTSSTSAGSGDARGRPPAFDLAELARRAGGAKARPAPAGEPFREGQGVDFPVDDPDVAAED